MSYIINPYSIKSNLLEIGKYSTEIGKQFTEIIKIFKIMVKDANFLNDINSYNIEMNSEVYKKICEIFENNQDFLNKEKAK